MYNAHQVSRRGGGGLRAWLVHVYGASHTSRHVIMRRAITIDHANIPPTLVDAYAHIRRNSERAPHTLTHLTITRRIVGGAQAE
mmetsp:Transcript_32628/g.64977  ORF Transcript_32628/g.64977 Transcript_32628/m.64977 type:complete len:84 (-) Transcript_32628:804-1055(-)